MSARAITEYLAHREHADPDAATRAGRQLSALRADRYFFRAWWLEALTPCLLSSRPATTYADASADAVPVDAPVVVLDRLAEHLGVRLSDAYLPHCPRCHRPLRLADLQVPRPTGYCRTCSRPPATRPARPITVPALTTTTSRPVEAGLFDLTDDLTEVAA